MKNRALIHLLLLICIGSATLAPAQEAEGDLGEAISGRGKRSLAVGNFSYLHDGPGIATMGWLYQVSLRPARTSYETVIETVVGDDGTLQQQSFPSVLTHYPPRWYLHGLVSGGVARQDGEWDGSGYLQVGILRRQDSKLLKFWGPAIQGILEPRGLGPVLRFEIMDNLGLQAGWIFLEEGDDRLFLSIDYFRIILEDLGLEPPKALR